MQRARSLSRVLVARARGRRDRRRHPHGRRARSLLPLVGRAQRAAFLEVQRELQSSLLLAAAERITSGETATLPRARRREPDGAAAQPAGELSRRARGAAAKPEIPRATWYFDEQRAGSPIASAATRASTAQDGPTDRIELRVAFVFEDRDADGVFDAAGDRLRRPAARARARLRLAGLKPAELDVMRRQTESVVTIAVSAVWWRSQQ